MPQLIATHIEIRPNRDGQPRAFVNGTRVRVQDVAMMSEVQGLSPDQIVDALPHLTLAQVHAALSYYFDHRSEIQSHIREDNDLVEQMKQARGQGVLEQRLRASNGPRDDAFSP